MSILPRGAALRFGTYSSKGNTLAEYLEVCRDNGILYPGQHIQRIANEIKTPRTGPPDPIPANTQALVLADAFKHDPDRPDWDTLVSRLDQVGQVPVDDFTAGLILVTSTPLDRMGQAQAISLHAALELAANTHNLPLEVIMEQAAGLYGIPIDQFEPILEQIIRPPKEIQPEPQPQNAQFLGPFEEVSRPTIDLMTNEFGTPIRPLPTRISTTTFEKPLSLKIWSKQFMCFITLALVLISTGVAAVTVTTQKPVPTPLPTPLSTLPPHVSIEAKSIGRTMADNPDRLICAEGPEVPDLIKSYWGDLKNIVVLRAGNVTCGQFNDK